MSDIDFTTQIVLWGYAILGEGILERGAIVAEGKNVDAIVPGAWDHDRRWIESQLVSHGDEPYHHPPEWWALACAPEIAMASL